MSDRGTVTYLTMQSWLLQVTRLTLPYEVLYKFWHILKQLSKL